MSDPSNASNETGNDSDSDGSEPKQHFPETQVTWIRERLGEGASGQSQIKEHVMRLYYRPLQYYFLGLKGLRNLGEPEDIVGGYFADRLSRDDFFDKWRLSGIKLRRWLMNGLHFFLKERIRAENRNRVRGPDVEQLQIAIDTPDPDEGFDREFAHSIVAEALQQVYKDCLTRGLKDHWDIFVRHHYHGESYKDFSHEYNIQPVRASVMSRTVRDRFRTAIRNLLAQDGVKPGEIESEIKTLMESMAN